MERCSSIPPKAQGIYKPSSCSIANLCQFRNIQLSLFESGIMPKKDCGVRWGLPICFPLALAFAIPERTRLLIMASSNWLNTPAICRNASLIGSALPSRQSSVIDPTMTRRKCFSRTVLMISHSCWVLLARRETSGTMMLFSG